MDVIRTDSVSKTYGGKRAVDGLRMRVSEGAIYGFVGRNGAGKSTVMKMIAGLVTPSDGGFTLFDGAEPAAGGAGMRGMSRASGRIGALIEHPGILPQMSAYDTMMAKALAIGVPDPGPVCRDLLAQVGLADVGRKRTKGFSLGMKQRLGLALALVGGPDLLLLDEPLNGLDPEAARAMRRYLVQLNQMRGITIVISSHVLDQLERMCTHYGVIAAGRMVRQMSAERVQAECGAGLLVRTADTAATMAVLEDAAARGLLAAAGESGEVRFAAEPDGSLTLSGAFDADAVSHVLHGAGQEIRELAVRSRDMEDYVVALMEGGR